LAIRSKKTGRSDCDLPAIQDVFILQGRKMTGRNLFGEDIPIAGVQAS
jgi:hypothetical protein